MASRTYSSPQHKLVSFFEKSRDGWKQKHHEVKKRLKHQQNQRRAVEKSRENWRTKAQEAQQHVAQLQAELAEHKKKLQGQQCT